MAGCLRLQLRVAATKRGLALSRANFPLSNQATHTTNGRPTTRQTMQQQQRQQSNTDDGFMPVDDRRRNPKAYKTPNGEEAEQEKRNEK